MCAYRRPPRSSASSWGCALRELRHFPRAALPHPCRLSAAAPPLGRWCDRPTSLSDAATAACLTRSRVGYRGHRPVLGEVAESSSISANPPAPPVTSAPIGLPCASGVLASAVTGGWSSRATPCAESPRDTSEY